MTELFTAALGQQAPWQVANARFELEARDPLQHGVIATRLPFPCCCTPDQPIHNRLPRD